MTEHVCKVQVHNALETIFEVLPNAPSMCGMKTVIVGGVTRLFKE